MFKGKNKFVMIITLLTGITILTMSSVDGMMMAYSQTAVQNSTSLLSTSTAGANNTSTSLRGGIASLQDNQNGSLLWIVRGTWNMSLSKPLLYTQNASNTAKAFNASFTMVTVNGSRKDKDAISQFNQTSSSVKNDSSQITFNGTATVTTKRVGQFQQVPVSITIIRNNAMSIWINPRNVNSYFGNMPIYGTVYQLPG